MTKLFLDSANLKEIKTIKDLGLLEGLTTNPIILRRALDELDYKGNFIDYAKKILRLTEDKPALFQAISTKSKDIIKQAKLLYSELKKYGNPVIKVPITTFCKEETNIYEGFKAIKELSKEGIPVLATAIVTPTQAFLAAKAGAKYTVLMLRPFDDGIAKKFNLELEKEDFFNNDMVLKLYSDNKKFYKGEYLSGIDNLERVHQIFKNNSLETKVLIAGIRNPVQASEVLQRGLDVMTLPYYVFQNLFPHERTEKFVQDTKDQAPKCYRDFLNPKKT